MKPSFRTPVAQYLRMSTEHQQYSLENQAAVLHCYAQKHELEIVETFSDGGRSGVLFKNRPALNHLLQEVINGGPKFKAILVYDISRWGRFQDADEAAHYEFLCKHANVPIHYCAEEFANNTAATNIIMKAIKRAMAAEFSRDLGEKVFSAEKRWAQLGYKQGGAAGYALNRLMISSDGKRRQLLEKGEAKCLQSDRVILVPGDPREVALVQEIFRLVIDESKTPHRIATELNERGVTMRGRKWYHQIIHRILNDPKYAGACVWNRSTRRLGQPNTPISRSEWIVKEGAFEPIVLPSTFEKAQQVLNQRICRKSNEDILVDLRKILVREGRLSGTLLTNTRGAPSKTACMRRFGSLKTAFELAKSLEDKNPASH